MHLLATDRSAGPAPGSAGALVLGLFRMLIGISFAIHGLSELFGKPVAPFGGHIATFGSWPQWWAGMIELVAGALVAAGIGTRVAALLCSGAMAYAYLSVHLKHGLLPIQNGGELAALFCWSFFLIAVIGPGALAAASLLPSTARRNTVSTHR
ncbi:MULTISPECIES: DoxX family protein [unclassified Nocardia]|uniref:DoxX family protein n=1 Tax=unclassified Nocardia TaxID=2637762 RepID=UPI001CE3ED8F|nr:MULTISPECIES: DoxX family protein [unclassified Nocardia]